MLRDAEDDAGADTKGILDVGGAVRKLGAEPLSLESSDREVARQTDINTATHMDGERIVVSQRSGRRGKVTVEAVGFSDQPLSEDGKALLPRTPNRSVPRVAQAEGRSDHRQANAAIGGITYLRSRDIGCCSETMTDLSG